QLRPTLAVDQAEGPILDEMSAGEPFVGPGEDEGAGHPHGEGGADLPGEDGALPLLALAHRIDAELGENERAIDGEVVQPRDVAAKGVLVMQIDVEAEEIGEVDRQILGGWEVGIADERAGNLFLDGGDEFLEEGAHPVG